MNIIDMATECLDFEALTVLLATLQVLAILAIAIIVFRQTSRLKKFECTQQIANSYNILNVAALSSDNNLLAFDSIGRTEIDEDSSIRRKRWAGFVWLATLQNVFLTTEFGMLDKAFGDRSLVQQLDIILKDDIIWEILNHRGFHPKFINYCAPIRTRALERVGNDSN